MKHSLNFLILILPLLFAGCSDGSDDFDACGQIEAVDVVVSAESNGKIISLDVPEGAVLAKGECVGVIDSVQIYLQKMELISRKQNAASRIVDIKKQLAPQKSRLENLMVDKERYVNLLAKDAGTQKQVDDIEFQIAVSKGEIDAQTQTYQNNNSGVESELAMYDVQIAQKEDMLRKCRIVSPVAGTVLTRYVEEGETVTSGKPIFRIADMNDVYVRAYFSTSQLADLKIGSKVKVYPDDGSNKLKEYEGTVTWISEQAEFTPKNIQTRDDRADLVYAVKISIANDGYLKLGMYAYVKTK
ncbi:MAG: efflux RND transporter periplasmic adaptor subunit [Bacteroidetes bacterium]|uniref:Efflux RND transporter periplasmic adaptor subunit n=1 Tax=Candidatus Enterocola intestinipullorum TaxID=2840783 RepID=A0A9D9EJ44_9BACT|nr:efflux RND transporter periplasmic adaptor subunit [Candidatus Enterocola intestinipullorum]